MNQKSTKIEKNDIVEMATAFRRSKLLLTALDLDIFSLIGEKSLYISNITYLLNSEFRATEKLLLALVKNNLLIFEDNKFSNTEHSKRYLIKSSQDYIEELEELFSCWEDWCSLKDSVFEGNLNKKASNYKLVYNKVNPIIYNEIIKHEPKVVLELGVKFASSYSGFINNIQPQFKIVSLDSSEKIEKVLSQIGSNLNSNNIEFVEGNPIENNLGIGYDLVISSMLLEKYSLKENLKIINNVWNSLSKGGKFIIHEKILPDDRQLDTEILYHSIELMVETNNTELYTQVDIALMLNEIGFSTITKSTLLNNEVIFTAIK